MLSSFTLPSLRRLNASSGLGSAVGKGLSTYTRNTLPIGAATSSRVLSRHTGSSGWASLVSLNTSAPNMQTRQRSNRSRRGLYDGKDIRAGNNVSFSNKKTKRKFKPNVFIKKIYSETLDEKIRFHLTASALRSVDKFGGLDNYLLASKHVTSGEGLEVKNRILRRMHYNEKKQAETMVVD